MPHCPPPLTGIGLSNKYFILAEVKQKFDFVGSKISGATVHVEILLKLIKLIKIQDGHTIPI